MTTRDKAETLPESVSNLALERQRPAEWATARCVYRIYITLAIHCDLGLPPCTDLEFLPENPEPEMCEKVLRWLDQVDQAVMVHQLRQIVQSVQNSDEESLHALVLRHLHKKDKSAADRDKVDFLLVQYFSLCAPDRMYLEDVELADVARVLKPLLGQVEGAPPKWLEPLDKLLETLKHCQSFGDLMEQGIIMQGRMLKSSAGEGFYEPWALIAFSRFNFLVRRGFFRLLQADVRAAREAITQLESRGVETVDCRAAELSEAEPTSRILQICQEWRKPFSAAYSAGRPFLQLLAIRAAVEQALAGPPPASEASATCIALPADAQPAQPPAPPPALEPPSPAAISDAAEPSAEPLPANLEHAMEPDAEKIAPAAACEAVPQESKGTPADAQAPFADPSAARITTSPPPIDLTNCLESIWEQLIAAPVGPGRSMTTVVLGDTKLMLASWEVAAFVREGGQVSEDLRRAVVARAVLAEALEEGQRTGDRSNVDAALTIAQAEVANLQDRAEQAKTTKNTEAAINLSMSAKRLLAYIEKAESLRV